MQCCNLRSGLILAVLAEPQDLIGCWNQRKLKALIPVWCGCFHGSSTIGGEREGQILLSSFIVLWSHDRKNNIMP